MPSPCPAHKASQPYTVSQPQPANQLKPSSVDIAVYVGKVKRINDYLFDGLEPKTFTV